MMMKGNTGTQFKQRYAVVIVDADLNADTVNQADLRYFDEYWDAELWIRTYGSSYGGQKLKDNIIRFFRIEKRYYCR